MARDLLLPVPLGSSLYRPVSKVSSYSLRWRPHNKNAATPTNQSSLYKHQHVIASIRYRSSALRVNEAFSFKSLLDRTSMINHRIRSKSECDSLRAGIISKLTCVFLITLIEHVQF